MMDEKAGLPPYSATPPSQELPRFWVRPRAGLRRSRALRFLVLGFLGFIVLAQWQQLSRANTRAPKLSAQKLNANLATCKKLRTKPQDPIGAGRKVNARYLGDDTPTLIQNATVWIGEPVDGTSEADARAGKGWQWEHADVLIRHGLIQRVEAGISLSSLPKDTIVYNAAGRLLTSGIIDMHSHAGDFPLPGLEGNADGNEMGDNITPWARSIDAILTFDPQIQVIKSGGVTTSLILPGSGNNMGGEAYLIKHAVGKPDGRKEISAEDMLADPDRNWRYMKMACGENAKRAHGGINHVPTSRMGESYAFRRAFEQARDLIQRQDDWCDKADAFGVDSMEDYLPEEIKWESLGAALRGQVHINTHCYTVPDLEAMVDHTNEFEFPVRAFHHAHQTYLVPEILKRTWGGRPPSSAIFADNMYYKTESYIGSEFAGKYLYDAGLTPVYVSDNPVLNAQHVLFEAAKGYHYGLPYHAAMASVTTAPADELGMGQRLGKIKPGFDADIAVWDSDPLSVGAAPVQVWIDGVAQYEDPVELSKPVAAPMVPDESLGSIIEEPTQMKNAIFTGVHKVLLSEKSDHQTSNENVNVVISGGKISCVGSCASDITAATEAGIQTLDLKNGYLTKSFSAVGGTLGLNEIDAEDTTDNGPSPVTFSRAVDGLMLEGKKLSAAAKYGATRAVSAPKYNAGGTHHGTSVAFLTTAHNSLEKGAVVASDVAAHYTLNLFSRAGKSYSAAYGELRTKLISAVLAKEPVVNPFSEYAYLKKVVEGDMVLALTIDSADGIATALKIKSEVESLIKSSNSASAAKIHMAIIGGGESHIVASELAAAGVGVILSPLQNKGERWDARRTLSGAPLTNGTTVDVLTDAGVTAAIGLSEDWEVRDLGLAAGTAYKNSNGRLSEKAALDLVSSNVFKILAPNMVDQLGDDEDQHFIVTEGSPMEIGSRIKAVGGGQGNVAVFV